MTNLIPQSVQSKMGVYEIEIGGANVKVSIVDNPAFVGNKMDELRFSLLYPKKKKEKKNFITNFRMAFLKKKKQKPSERRVVGLDIKFVKTDGNLNKGKFLILCVGSDCLMIQLPDSENISDTLGRFLSDETICFLGTEMSNIVSELGSFYFYTGRRKMIAGELEGHVKFIDDTESLNLKTGVEVSFMAAKILKKPNVENYGLAELAGEVGIDMDEPISECPDWNAKVFSHEDVKYAVHNAYTSCVIGNKLFDML